ncbi:HDOD domain-containing protein [Nitrosophilus kaiyonis]|uniref:HDOD domain-containing protein n=1 Tax=Nitrosophilus kaiyonis TaxID=2930200 RepID=UPI0024920E2B|nr:HDOD domain-containing protein [Nitrosophilus kaiyonis]
MSIKDFIINEIDKLPPLPKTVQELKISYEDDNSTAQDLENIIKKDPVLVVDILRLANSPYYGFSHEIHDLRHAIVLFGFDEIINFAIYSALEKSFEFDLSPYSINELDFLNLSILKQNISKKFFKENKNLSILLKSSSFLSDIGKIVLAKYAKENSILIVEEEKSLKDIDNIEKERLEYDTIDVSCLIFEKWNFDKKFIDIIYNSKKCSQNEVSNYLNSIRNIVTIKANILDTENVECIDKEIIANAL